MKTGQVRGIWTRDNELGPSRQGVSELIKTGDQTTKSEVFGKREAVPLYVRFAPFVDHNTDLAPKERT